MGRKDLRRSRRSWSNLPRNILALVFIIMCIYVFQTNLNSLAAPQAVKTTPDTRPLMPLHAVAAIDQNLRDLVPSITGLQEKTYIPNDVPEDRPMEVIPQSRNLCMGMAAGIDYTFLRVFLASFRQVNKDATLVLLVELPVSKEHEQMFVEFNVKIVDIRTLDFKVQHQGSEIDMTEFHPSSTRWIFMAQLLREYSSLYDQVLLIDVRDSMFQSDPFKILDKYEAQGGGLVVFQEGGTGTIGKCGWNSGWVKSCFGDEVLQRIQNNPIICSGVSIGTYVAIQTYVDTMANEILGRRTCERNGIDQGVHNVLVYGFGTGRKISDGTNQVLLHVENTETGSVAHIQTMTNRRLRTDGLLYNGQGEPFVIVHQYDRDRILQNRFFKRW